MSTPSTRRPPLKRPGAAQYIGVKVPTLASWASQGIGPIFHRVGRLVVYLPDELDEWLAANASQATPQVPASPAKLRGIAKAREKRRANREAKREPVVSDDTEPDAAA